MQCYMQAGNITTNLKVEVEFNLPELSATNFGTWKFHVDDSAKGRYNMILEKISINIMRVKFKTLSSFHRSG